MFDKIEYKIFSQKYNDTLMETDSLISDVCEVLEHLAMSFTSQPEAIKYKDERGKNNSNILLPKHIYSSQNTLQSIFACCSIGSLSDVDMLIRKYRDDLFQLAFFIGISKEIPKDKNNLRRKVIWNWLSNVEHEGDTARKVLSADVYLDYFRQNKKTKELFENFVNKTWKDINKIFNDSAHSNYARVQTINTIYNREESVCEKMNEIRTSISLITAFFVATLFTIKPTLFMCDEYMVTLDCGGTPEEELKYEVPKFIKEFFYKYIGKIDIGLRSYLFDTNHFGMKIE